MVQGLDLSGMWGDTVYYDLLLELSTTQPAKEATQQDVPHMESCNRAAAGLQAAQHFADGSASSSDSGSRIVSGTMPVGAVDTRGTCDDAGHGKVAHHTGRDSPAASWLDVASASLTELPVPETIAQSHRLHAVILANSSEYFKVRTQGLASGNAIDYAGPAAAGRAEAALGDIQPPRWHLVDHVEEAELAAVADVLQFCYSGHLCETIGSSLVRPAPSVSELLQIRAIADRYGLVCKQACCASHSLSS